MTRPTIPAPAFLPRTLATFLTATLAVTIGLATPAPAASDTDAFVEKIETAHGADAWRQHAALETRLRVSGFGGGTIIDGTVLFDTPVGRSRIEPTGGVVMVFDGRRAWVWPPDAEVRRARFHLLTWPYFLAAPFKLRDPGVHLEDRGEMLLQDGRKMPAVKVTFDPGTGDAPDDWYIVYRDPRTDRVAALAYIVTYGKSVEQAEKEPHVAIYEDYQTVDGVALPTRIRFYDWSEDKGAYGDALGEVVVESMRFRDDLSDDAFVKPAGAREDKLPE